MTIYPIDVPRSAYRGSNVSKRRRAAEYDADARRLERYLNAQSKRIRGQYSNSSTASLRPKVGLAEARVREILFRVDCGHNGLTVAKNAEDWRAFIESLPGSAGR